MLSISYAISDAKCNVLCDILSLTQVEKVNCRIQYDIAYDIAYDIVYDIYYNTMVGHFVREIFLTTFVLVYYLHMCTSMASFKDVPESGTLTGGVGIECTADSSSSAVNSILSTST